LCCPVASGLKSKQESKVWRAAGGKGSYWDIVRHGHGSGPSKLEQDLFLCEGKLSEFCVV